ncbi:MAG: hypothetical protein FJ087_17850 [Deltaproteobacteria bacterium]|nr:hypothetical protein [Deltaproteobacteria bacterium]
MVAARLVVPVPVLAAILALAACSQLQRGEWIVDDVAADAPKDAATDGAGDAPTDAATDAPADVAQDAADVASDPPADPGTEAPTDLPGDVPGEVPAEAVEDAPADVAPDLPAPEDTAADDVATPPDEPPDVPADAPPDVPCVPPGCCGSDEECVGKIVGLSPQCGKEVCFKLKCKGMLTASIGDPCDDGDTGTENDKCKTSSGVPVCQGTPPA